MLHKTCTKCGAGKALEAFPAQRRNKDGRDSRCNACAADAARAYKAANPERVKASQKACRANSDRSEYLRSWFAENKSRRQTWREANADTLRESFRQWCARNPGALASKGARRRAMKAQATPGWADASAIAAIYALSADLTELTGIPHHVDHEVPLINPRVCGLHVHTNLRVIPAKANQSKGNRFTL